MHPVSPSIDMARPVELKKANCCPCRLGYSHQQGTFFIEGEVIHPVIDARVKEWDD